MRKIAIPLTNGVLSTHFGHCQQFYLCEVNDENIIIEEKLLTAPPHEPGLLPKWLHEQGATQIIAGGMGQRAISLFEENKIDVSVGAPQKAPKTIIEEFLSGALVLTTNYCDH